MFGEIDLSLARERNAEMLREARAERLGKRLRANRGPRPGSRRIVGAFLPRGFAIPFAGAVRGGREGVGPKDA